VLQSEVPLVISRPVLQQFANNLSKLNADLQQPVTKQCAFVVIFMIAELSFPHSRQLRSSVHTVAWSRPDQVAVLAQLLKADACYVISVC
jgi:hypothetical protein